MTDYPIDRGDQVQLAYDKSAARVYAHAAPSGLLASVSITRPNDTNAYSAGDVEGAATGSTAAKAFAFADKDGNAFGGGHVIINETRLEFDISSVPSGMTSYRLHLYSATPPSALGDNAAWDLPSGDRAAYLGYIDLGTPVDVGSTLWVQQTGNLKQLAIPSGGVVYGYLQTLGAYTPAAQTVRKVTLLAVPL